MKMRQISSFFATILLAAVLSAGVRAAPEADLWERWTAHDATSRSVIDHSPWTEFLGHYVKRYPDGISRLRYGMITPADRSALETYINGLVSLPISRYNRNQQRAFWINLYNALTVKVVLDHFPVDSIRDIDISPGLFSNGPWDKKLVIVEGEEVSLNDIEHRILRPIWRDPRIHYAVNCASIGCPNLIPVAFSADNADTLLDKGAVSYVNHPRGVSITGKKLTTSSIYVWFKQDFGDSDAGVIAHLKKFARPELETALEKVSRIADDDYDWSLNGVNK